MPVIEVKNLTKQYGRNGVTALDGLDLDINEGEIFGVIGPNGAGKTTLVKILLALIRPTHGDAKVFGQSPGKPSTREKIGFLPEDAKFPSFLTGEKVLRYYGGLAGYHGRNLRTEIDRTLSMLELDSWRKHKVKNYSRGMQQKLGICQALLGEPRLLFLDEPTSGIDPVSRRKIRDMIAGLKERGITVMINSHNLTEIEKLCDRVAIVKEGKIVRLGTMSQLTSLKHRIRFNQITEKLEEVLTDCIGTFIIEDKNCITIDVENQDALNEAIDKIRELKINILEISPRQTLEDIYIQAVGDNEVAQ